MEESGNNPSNNSFDKIMALIAILALIGFLMGLFMAHNPSRVSQQETSPENLPLTLTVRGFIYVEPPVAA